VNAILAAAKSVSRLLNVIGGISLVFIVALTTADVILRLFRRPILGTYEIVGFSGCVVILFALPLTSWMRGHIFVDFLIIKLPRSLQIAFNVFTRCLVTFLFFLFAWNLIKYGTDLRTTGEVSTTLKIPFYPVIYAAGVCCVVQCLVMLCDIVKIFRGEYGE